MRTIKFQIIIRNEIDGYERLTEKDGKIYWEWMSYVTNPQGREYWNKGVYPYGHKYIRRQFTEFYDRNGKEVYEADIDQYGRVCTYYRGSFIMEHKTNPSYAYLGDCEHIEIIGNLYQTPELLNN